MHSTVMETLKFTVYCNLEVP